MNPYKSAGLRSYLESIPQNKYAFETKKQDEINKQVYNKFISCYKKGKCFLCKHSINAFVKKDPCFHWLLLPKDITKNELKKYLCTELSFYRLESYLRWIANTELFIGSINDLEEEKPNNAFICETIKFKNLEWTLLVGNNDKDGHEASVVGNKPHYHIQIMRDNRIYFKFNDAHILLSDDDLFSFECIEQAGDIFKIGHTYGEGISIIENAEKEGWLDELDSVSKNTDDLAKATIHRHTIISAPPGGKISGKMLEEAMEESKRTKEPIGRIMARLNQDLEITTVLEPSENVPEMKKRNQRK